MTVRAFATAVRAFVATVSAVRTFAASVGAARASLLRLSGVRLAEKFGGGVLHARAAASVFERVAAQTVSERHGRDAANVFDGNLSAPLEGCEGARGSRNRYLAAMSVNAESRAEFRNRAKQWARDGNAF